MSKPRYCTIATSEENLTPFRDRKRSKCLLVSDIATLLNEREELEAERESLLAFTKDFISEWEDTWVDPDDQRHEWSELYKTAKQLVRDSSGGHVAKPESEAQP